MRHHEKVAFLKFFITYFVSVALLILVAGFFYFEQTKGYLLRMEEFSLIEYARHIKMGENLDTFGKDYHHDFLRDKQQYIDIRNFKALNGEFIKIIPMNHNTYYLQVFKSKHSYDENLWNLKKRVIAVQILLLLMFAFLSYKLAKNALKPLQESISKLDKFAKDLIHDLNTPVTSIKLNMKLLEKNPTLQGDKIVARLNKSVHNISELHENLNILLQEETFQMQRINICTLVNEVVDIQKGLYSSINFQVDCSDLKVKLNPNATKQILQNIISNACKYNSQNGYVKIYQKNGALYIEDSGKGIKEPEKIFERSYSAEHSTGIGLDIVKRLALAMDITIEVTTSDRGSCFILRFT
ncbi:MULTISPECIES: HAMP domain-containing sensor histidine kinase [Sulfurimonas]|uniref:sensor histidine kinase n=1 Tax=Sulfurimonas TaxID=202746 RepID=UPI001264E21A|nr:HAMP domain-containing sensor histidine kinase [Sulfurimonas indica]